MPPTNDVDHIIDSTYGVLATPQLQHPDYMDASAHYEGITYTGRLYPSDAKIITMTEEQFNALIADAKDAGMVPMTGSEFRERYS